jgi:hypothetical protein
VLLASSAWLTSAWGAAPGGSMSAAALDFLRWRALGAPITVLLLTLQVGGLQRADALACNRGSPAGSRQAARAAAACREPPLVHAASRCCCCCHLPQGVYRGLQDTRTPFYATAAANAFNVALGPVLIFWAGLGVKGAAMATVAAQVGARVQGRRLGAAGWRRLALPWRCWAAMALLGCHGCHGAPELPWRCWAAMALLSCHGTAMVLPLPGAGLLR